YGDLSRWHSKLLGVHVQQNASSFGSDAPHRQTLGLHRSRTARSALIDSDVGAAHDAGGFVVCDVQFIGHHLPKGSPGALATVGLADVEGCRVVRMNDDP